MTSRPPARRRGSTLVMVTLMAVCLALVVSALLQYALTEARLNRVHILRTEASNAAEAALEYGAAELAARLKRNRTFNTESLEASPLTTHSSRAATLFAQSGERPTAIDPASIRLHVSQVSTPISRRVNARDPNNAFDPLRGQTVTSRYVRMLSAATARHSTFGATSAYATQTIEVRDSQLFNYAIFYNLRMEFHPAPAMEVWGPVHSNEDVYLTGSSTVHYFDTFTTAGQMIAQGFAAGRPAGRSIFFSTGVDDDQDNRPDTISISGHSFAGADGEPTITHVDSLLNARVPGAAFSDKASQLWRGNAQDASLGVEKQNPPGVLNPTDARKLIEPPDTSEAANKAIEDQKFSRKAGLYILVEAVANEPRVTFFQNADDALAYKTAPDRVAWAGRNPQKILVAPKDLISTDRRMRDNRELKTINMVDINLGVMREAIAADSRESARFQLDGKAWDHDAGWNGAVYVEVENPAVGFNADPDNPSANGSNSSNNQGVGIGSGSATAVRLVNGKRLPSLAASRANPDRERGLSLVTNAPVYIAGHFNANGDFGTANRPDGTERAPDPGYQNGTPTNHDDDTEVPALVAGDAINILSENWLNSNGKPVGDGRENNLGNNGRKAADTEVSAVMMGGIVESSEDGTAYSGGVENYFRFHEDWNRRTLRYRGSIVALFRSNYATAGMAGKRDLYSPPIRRWGFHDFLRNGEYPPFTPRLRTYRRLDYREITKAEYEALLADSAHNFQSMAPEGR